MNQVQKKNRTPKSILFMMLLFGSMICLVIAQAYTRRSGNTGIDTAKIQQIRYAPVKEIVSP